MTTLRKLALSAFLSVSALSAVTMTSCNKDDKECEVGTTGSDCKTNVISSYATNNYKGNGSDNKSGTYTNWSVSVMPTSTTDPKKFAITLKDDSGAPQFVFAATLTTNSAFNLDGQTVGSYTYAGSGTITGSSVSLTVNQTGPENLIITFSNLVKQ